MAGLWLSEVAETDLDVITDHIACDDPLAAVRMRDQIEQRIELLVDQPRLGRRGRIAGTREMVLSGTPFIVVYRPYRDGVLILRVLHGARRWPPPDR